MIYNYCKKNMNHNSYRFNNLQMKINFQNNKSKNKKKNI